MTDRLSYKDLTGLRDLALENGDEYLLAAVDEAITRGQETAGVRGRLQAVEGLVGDAEAYARWLKVTFIEPHNEERKVFWSRVTRCLGAIRGPGDAEAKLRQVENILLEFDAKPEP